MDLIERVARAAHNSLPPDTYADSDLITWYGYDLSAMVDGSVDFAALARAAISEIFDWLEKPSEEARVSGVAEFLKGRTPFPMEVWSAMLSELRKEALGDDNA